MYIDFDFYANVYNGAAIDEDDFDVLAKRASELIDAVTSQRIRVAGIANLTQFQQEKVKEATAAQVEYLYENGGAEFIASAGSMTSVSVGRFRIGSDAARQGGLSNGLISPMVSAHLALTGLLYTGVGICI